MAKEIKINLIGKRVEKPAIIKKQAAKCIQGRTRISSLSQNLSRQMFDDAPTLYLNPTERMFFSDLVVPGEPVATVLGSGDFAFESAFHGSRDVLTFDINSNQYYAATLKLKGLQNLSYEDFWNFFSNVESSNWFSPEVYKKLKACAEKDQSLYAFFDEVMTQRMKEDRARQAFINRLPFLSYTLSGLSDVLLDQILSSSFPMYEPSAVFRTISGMGGEKDVGTYLEGQETYSQTQEAIKKTNISFVKADLISLKAMLERFGYFKDHKDIQFGAIYLSNVPEFINGDVFARAVEEQLMPLLQSGGTIAYCCQGTSADYLNMGDAPLNNLKSQLAEASPVFQNMAAQQILNSVEGLRLIREKANVELVEVPTLCEGNGISDKDTYVYVKKK